VPPGCDSAFRKPGGQITDRAHRYRAQRRIPAGPRRCALCASTRFLVVDHIDSNESNDEPDNLRWLCKSCNTRLGIEAARLGRGRRTRQYNPGAETLVEYVKAAVSHHRGEHDEGGSVIHQTPSKTRSEFAQEIWRRRRERGTDTWA
jgi:hypothetical protein